ncbi:MAG TPA: hypothetical protein VL461_07495 [Dictyobacter sp.]|nr:hypothetical protein [Dictyobacter sp.]
MSLPLEIPAAQVLITVKTYPQPSNKYNELVCTAGFLPDGHWIRLYPIPFRALPYKDQYEKYHWITLDLVKNSEDFRPESYKPLNGVEKIIVGEKIGTENGWAKRKEYALKEVFTSMTNLITLAKGKERKSLATLQPREIIDVVVEQDDRDWKPTWLAQLRQFNLFDLDEKGEGKIRQVLQKIPYKFSYKFLSAGDSKPRQMLIEDWELGALYWNCLRMSGGDEQETIRLVKKKYFDEFCNQKDLYFFLGTTKQFHLVSPNPFIVIGVFYPPKPRDTNEKIKSQSTLKTDNIQQQSLFDL